MSNNKTVRNNHSSRISVPKSPSLNSSAPKNSSGRKFEFLMIPMLLMILVPPLMLGLHIDYIPDELKAFWISDTYMDYFAHHASLASILLAIAMLVIIFFLLKKDMVPKSRSLKVVLLSIGVFSILTMISTIFAIHKETALWGSPGRNEGLFVQLSYMVALLYAILIIKNKTNPIALKRTLNFALLILSSVISILTITQLMGIDLIFDGPFFKFLTRNVVGEVERADGGAGIKTFLSLSFGNPNYVGSYVAIMMPMLVAMVADKKNTTIVRYSALVLSFLTAVTLFMSRSQAGIVGIFIAMLVLLIINFKAIISHKRALLATVMLVPVIMMAVYFSVDEQSKADIKATVQEATELFKKSEVDYGPYYGLAMEDYFQEDGDMTINTVLGSISPKFNENKELYFVDAKGNPIASTYIEENGIHYLAQPFAGISYKLEPPVDIGVGLKLIFELDGRISNTVLIEANYTEGFHMITSDGSRIDLIQAPHIGFEGKERLGSNRGYIWSRSLPLLKDTIIKGVGPDNYWLAFPQWDYWAKTYFSSGYGSWDITDKPHNMYLQWGINNGVVALLSLLVVFGIYLFRSGRELFRWNQSDPDRTFKVGILCAVVGYLATGMFNDSITSIAPIFWTLLGLGIAMMDVDQKVG